MKLSLKKNQALGADISVFNLQTEAQAKDLGCLPEML